MRVAARFGVGDAVRVRRAAGPGHVRTPAYCRGQGGVVERICGVFGNPERLAYGGAEDPVTLYRVRFRQDVLWPDYDGGAGDTVEIEIYEHWLEADDGRT